ncbi:MAG: TetR/AcrR family transcriptional regulator [Thermoleophilaceae bacterium]|nr:TetR/AcrR family transcriptional regulator [Thermoleophilaceae bacterium]
MSATYADASRTLLRDTVLDAVGELLADRTWGEVNMTEVAARAGVSRQTLYNAFGSRHALAQAYVSREADRFLVTVEAAVRESGGDARGAIAAAMEIFLAAAESHPLVRAISASDTGDELLALVTTRGGPVLESVIGGLSELIGEQWPQIPAPKARAVAETMVRLGISHAALPSDTPRRTAGTVAELLGPHLDELVAAA